MNSRSKGVRGELEAAAYLSDIFNLPCRRGQQYAGGPDSPDVIGIDGLHVEVKRCERFNAYTAIEQAKRDAGPDEVPIVLHRRNRKPWLVIVEADDLIPLTTTILHLAKHLNNNPAEVNNEPDFVN